MRTFTEFEVTDIDMNEKRNSILLAAILVAVETGRRTIAAFLNTLNQSGYSIVADNR